MRTKHLHIADQLRREIVGERWAPGQLLPPESALAQRFGVNRLTLRKAMAQLADEGMVSRQQGRGTFVQAAPAAATASVLFIGGRDESFQESFQLDLARAAQDVGWAALSLATVDSWRLSDAEAEHLGRLLPWATTVVCLSALEAAVRPLVPAHVPVVVADLLGRAGGRPRELPPCWLLAGDDRTGARLATLHLAALGHRRIAYVGPAQVPGEGPGAGRPGTLHTTWRGYCDGLVEAGLNEPIAIGLPLGTADWQASGDAVLVEVLSTLAPSPTAFVCDADFRASNVMRAAAALGLRAPDDFSVVGIFNTPWCEMLAPPLTSVSIEAPALAELALLLAGRPAPAETTVVRVAPKLVVRGSCGPPPSES